MCAIRSVKDAWATANEVEVTENVQTASMITRKSKGDMRICCCAVEDEPAKSVGDEALEVTDAGGSKEAGSVERGVVGTETGGGESGTGTPPTGTVWDGCSSGVGVRSSARSSSTTSGGRR